jgi:hypothetical protein
LADSVVERDGVGELFAIEALVLDPENRPAVGVRVIFTVGWDGASLHPEAAESGGTRLVHWASADTFVRLGECDDGSGRPCTFIDVQTDASGVARAQLFVDVLPDSGANIPVFANAGGEVASTEIGFEESSVVQ